MGFSREIVLMGQKGHHSHTSYFRRLIGFVILSCLVAVFSMGCTEGLKRPVSAPLENRNPFVSSQASKVKLRNLRKVLLAPVFVGQGALQANNHLAMFEGRLEEVARGQLGIESVSGRDVKKRAIELYGTRRPNYGDRLSLMESFGCDSLLETEIVRFDERVGSTLGANSPAQVGVQYRLFTKEREPVWEANYHFNDRALTEDLLSVRNRFSGVEGAGFKGAPGLVEKSILQAVGELESQREQSFIR